MMQKIRILGTSFPQSLGGNPFKELHGCPTGNFGHDGKDGGQESTFNKF